MTRHYPLHIQISTLFLLLILLVGGLIGGIGYKLSRDMIETAAADLTQRIGQDTLGSFRGLLAPAETAVGMLAHHTLAAAATLDERLGQLALMREALRSSPALSSVYLGYRSGDFFFVRRLFDDAERSAFDAPAAARYMVQSIERGGADGVPRGAWLYLDEELAVLRRDERADYAAAYDPRSRGWYADASRASTLIRTAPYRFFSNGKIGMTLATRAGADLAVVGADILLETLGSDLARQKVTPGAELAVVDDQGLVVAHPGLAAHVAAAGPAGAPQGLPRLEALGVPVLAGLGARVRGIGDGATQATRVRIDGENWRAMITPLMLPGTQRLFLVNAIPDRELLAAAIRLRATSLLVTALIIVLAVPVVWLMARAISKPLRALAGEAEAIRHFEFTHPVAVRSMVKEVDELARTMDGMKRAIRRFLDLSAAVAAEEDFDRLLPMLLAETMAAADAEAGVLYLADDDRLSPAAVRNADGDGSIAALPALTPEQAGPLLRGALRDGAPQAGRVHEEDIRAHGLAHAAFAGDAAHGIAVPLLNRGGQLVGAMLLLRRSAIEDSQLQFVKALSGSASSSLETRELIKVQKDLFEAFIQLIAGAIDAKSPYTGGHCSRVPELTKMLAQAACDQSAGPWQDFCLSEDEWEAVHVASWLHDCGKVITPEYVVDKATKLETLYDRIHEVRMRFEVLKRDARIAYLEALAAGAQEDAARARLEQELQALDDDFAFVAECNEGGEFMAPERIERLERIAARTWMRTLDDRLGISHDELARKQRVPAPALPVAEPVLSDRPEHLFERREQDRMPQDNPWGFRMRVPELLYNRGELHNLRIARGTLSDEERYKINEHIVQTEIMLRQLPFPRYLRNVPEIAAGHHEKMDGTGYPKGLRREDMSPVARMMAIADIFEALTAADRPYKKGKTLSEAIRIMDFMRRDQHIDGELFELFLRAGVYREYARRFMPAAQIDEVDVEQYLGAAEAAG